MNWTSTSISILALIISAVVGYITWKNRDESRKARDYSVMAKILDMLDNDKARKDREYIYTMADKGGLDFYNIPKVIDQVGKEKLDCIERTINAFDNLGYLLITGYSNYQDSPTWVWETTSEMWKRLNPFIYYFRTQPGRRKGYAESFELLFKEAQKRI